MRFWWPDWQPRERSPSTDSECSTASHSSLASDASFYSAASDGAGAAELADVRAGADPLGLRLRIGDPPAPVLGSAGAENGPGDPPRAAPLLGTGEELAGATSGTGPRPAAPIAPIAGPRAGPSGGQAEARSAASTSRRFAATASGRGPADPNAHADRLANRALDLRRTMMECGAHTAGDGCTNTTLDPMPVLPPQPTPRAPPPTPAADTNIEMQEPEDEDLADIDDGEVYAAMRIGPDAVPQRRPRLRLRQLTEAEDDAAREMVERLGATLAAKITDASDWESAEGYITALPHLLYDKLQPYSQAQRRPEPRPQRQRQQHQGSQCPRQQRQQGEQRRQRPLHDQGQDRRSLEGDAHGDNERDGDASQQDSARRRQCRRRGRSGAAKRRRRRRPPRVTRHHREHRLDEALDDLHAVEQASPGDRTAVRRARRRVGRVNSAIDQQHLRHRHPGQGTRAAGDAKDSGLQRRHRIGPSGASGRRHRRRYLPHSGR
ncbi:hypothetical protein PHYSODRAFT_251067 [Phytophthora sojae]|uniref:Uncharacterized protein n=1 Tax=Phytophthora sojae (strain P6497) TaxID=1094619 RepID=G4ZN44_PHYSP|nr:hypothetical protein PHYSODRAFT_251067 [Phytophthora sojae]EGZ15367.1 hypothetical protein PHYSODRAFT_251067 [Phytophthora sojae]|eukprot:XP_009529116.1 hypothetical protein PHYSODRAFT_251067 [Phytophthora sojae]